MKYIKRKSKKFPYKLIFDNHYKVLVPAPDKFQTKAIKENGSSLISLYLAGRYLGHSGDLAWYNKWAGNHLKRYFKSYLTVNGVYHGLAKLVSKRNVTFYKKPQIHEKALRKALRKGHLILLATGYPSVTNVLFLHKGKVKNIFNGTIKPVNFGKLLRESTNHTGYRGVVIVKGSNADIFLRHMFEENAYIKKHGSRFKRSYDNPVTSFKEAKRLVSRKKTVKINCRAPIDMALHSMGIEPHDLYASNGSFKHKFRGEMKSYLKKVNSCKGLTVKQAVARKKLKPGDIVCCKNHTHTFAYTGKGCKMFDGGSRAERKGYSKVGIILDYYKIDFYDHKPISSVLRWK